MYLVFLLIKVKKYFKENSLFWHRHSEIVLSIIRWRRIWCNISRVISKMGITNVHIHWDSNSSSRRLI